MLKVEALFGGSGNMLAQRNFENVISRPFGAIMDHFITFFHLLNPKTFVDFMI